MISLKIYNNLCNKRKSNKKLYKKGSDIHQHHILPKHMGGQDNEENYTYLTVREHIIAHYLLYRIYKSPNDLRSMHMLGAILTHKQRTIVGIFCYNNKIGFHNEKFDSLRNSWKISGHITQKEQYEKHDIKNYYYWSTKEGRSERAKLGGTKSCKTNLAFINQKGSFKDKNKAKEAAAKTPRFPINNGKINKKLYSKEEALLFILNNPEWSYGYKSKIT